MSQSNQTKTVARRGMLRASAGAMAAGLLLSTRGAAAEMSAAERANVQIVNDFCAAWPKHDLEQLVAFFAENGSYRVTETQEPNKGKAAVRERIKSFLDRVGKFEVLDTYAKGPMVFNERKDYFTAGPLKMWHGVGVFFLKDGKIVEWYDYTIDMDRG